MTSEAGAISRLAAEGLQKPADGPPRDILGRRGERENMLDGLLHL